MSQTPDDSVITMSILTQVMNEQTKNLNEVLSVLRDSINKIQANYDARFNEMGGVIQQIVDAMKQGQQQIAPADNKPNINIADIAAQLKEIIGAAKEAGLIKGESMTPIDERYQIGLQQNLNKLYNRSLQVAWKASENLLAREIKGVTGGLAKQIVAENAPVEPF